MKKMFSALAVGAFAILLSGCATLMRDASSQQIAPPSPGKAKIVFMRTSFVAGAIGCEMFEVVDGQLRFFGQLPSGNKVAYETTPGAKVFMAYGTAADFMLANVEAGKTYYAIVRPNWGTGGFYPTPIRRASSTEPDWNSKEFKEWMSTTKLTEPTEAAPAWFTENKTRLQGIYTDYWGRFQKKNSQEKAARTMNPEDGR